MYYLALYQKDHRIEVIMQVIPAYNNIRILSNINYYWAIRPFSAVILSDYLGLLHDNGTIELPNMAVCHTLDSAHSYSEYKQGMVP